MLLLGPQTIEFEDYLFFQQCSKAKSAKGCNVEYKKIYNDRNLAPSIYFAKIKASLFNSLRGIKKTELLNRIRNSSVFINDKSGEIVLLKIRLPSSEIYLQINDVKAEPLWMVNIFSFNGSSIYNSFISPKSHLQIVGQINDPDGYTNVHEKASRTSKVTSIMKKDEQFYYTPNSESKWRKVESLDGLKKGYMSSNKIVVNANSLPKTD